MLTFRHYKGFRLSAKRTGRLYPRRNPWYSLSETESTSEHVILSGVPRKKSPVTPPGINPGMATVGWRKCKAMGNKEGKQIGNSLLRVGRR